MASAPSQETRPAAPAPRPGDRRSRLRPRQVPPRTVAPRSEAGYRTARDRARLGTRTRALGCGADVCLVAQLPPAPHPLGTRRQHAPRAAEPWMRTDLLATPRAVTRDHPRSSVAWNEARQPRCSLPQQERRGSRSRACRRPHFVQRGSRLDVGPGARFRAKAGATSSGPRPLPASSGARARRASGEHARSTREAVACLWPGPEWDAWVPVCGDRRCPGAGRHSGSAAMPALFVS